MRKKFLGVMLALTMCVTTIAPTTAFASTKKESTTTTYTVEGQAHGTTAFSDITYKRPDFKAIKADINKLTVLMKKKKQYNNIKKLDTTINDAMKEVSTMITYLNIEYTNDVTNMDILNEKNLVEAESNNIAKLYFDAWVQILDSQYGAKIKKEMTKEQVEAIYKQHDAYCDEYIDNETLISNLCSDYEIALNTTSVDVNGTDMTLADLAANASSLSAEDYTKYYNQLLKATDEKAGEVYLKLVEAYKKRATLKGYDNFTDCMYDQYDRDYTKEQTTQFAQYAKESIAPLYNDLIQTFTEDDVAKILSVSGSLEPFESRFKKYFASIHPNMIAAYNYLKKYDLCDFKASPVKQQLNYTTLLQTLNEPYIHLAPMGNFTDVTQFVHEFGHFYAFYTHGTNLNNCLDIMEIHSQTDELLFIPNYTVYKDACQPVVKNLILSKLSAILQGCLYDEFQQKVYSGNYTTVKELNELFFDLECQYGLADPSMGTESYDWVFVPHTFEMPLYYISYAVSSIPALEIYAQSLTDRKAAIATYNKVIKLGTDYTFSDLLMKVHLRSPFSDYTLSTLADSLYNEFGLSDTAKELDPAA